jgi:TonB family protein
MPPTVKENEIAAAGPETAQRPAPASAPSADTGFKQQPVALEVPVTVNGARTVEGGDKREPFSETTKTVLVFGNGAVIRLASSVAPGQLLFLTNEKTKKEVVCQVVKSKNYRNVSGYVELEFTESVVGFWGMRFPGDRIGSGPQPVASAPANTTVASGSTPIPRPVAPRVEVPAASIPPTVEAAKPAVRVAVVKEAEPKLAESKFVIPEARLTPVPATPKVEEPIAQRPVAPVSPLSSNLATSFDPTAPLNLPAATPPPVTPAAPVATVSTIPEVPVTPAPVHPVGPESVLFDAPRVSEAQASFLEPAKSATVPLASAIPNLLSLFEAKPVAPPVLPPLPAPPAVDPETEALKQQTARLQEQLSSMLFSGTPAEPATVSVKIPHVAPVTIQKELAESAAKVLEIAHASKPEPAPARPVEPVKLDPAPVKSSLADEELKIPSWLEPLARNAAAPSSTQELIDREKARRQTEQPKVEQIVAEASTVSEEHHVPELPLPSFIDPFPLEEEKSTRESGTKKSGKSLLFAAIAAGLLVLVGGGWWFLKPQSAGVHAGPAPAPSAQGASVPVIDANPPSQPAGNAQSQTNSPAQTNPAALTNTSAPSNSASNTLSIVPAVSSVSTARNSQPNSNSANGGGRSTSPAAAAPAEVEQPKKPALGEVHLAAPKVNSNRSAQNSGEPDAGITLTNDEQPDSGAEALNAGLVGGNKQPSAPVAPLPVGGDVKQAELISKVAPIYPALAKNQHVSGNVLVDALIDANGKVTTMKVISGPALLHQAAMDALRLWKYQPATLDGKAVPMHLTVTLQFRLQ